jgi:L-ascorbate metabolism protein UlaG (beta-lactamase superfamily)
MNITYYGHSVVFIEAGGKKIIIDPFITGNGQCPIKQEDLQVDVILLTHGHNDHVGDTVELAKRCDALVVAPFELATYLSWKGIKTHPMHIGGAYSFDFGTVKLTQAFHGSSYEEEGQKIVYTGMPAGILFTHDDNTIYHAGDTALFSDMKLIGELNAIDLAFLPIGDNFTMGPEDAAIATEWLQAKTVVPIHFNTFPVIEQNPEKFLTQLTNNNGLLLEPGESYQIKK